LVIEFNLIAMEKEYEPWQQDFLRQHDKRRYNDQEEWALALKESKFMLYRLTEIDTKVTAPRRKIVFIIDIILVVADSYMSE
jgi:hypothetical protein